MTITISKSYNDFDANKLYVCVCLMRKDQDGLDLSPEHLVVLIVPLSGWFSEYDCGFWNY